MIVVNVKNSWSKPTYQTLTALSFHHRLIFTRSEAILDSPPSILLTISIGLIDISSIPRLPAILADTRKAIPPITVLVELFNESSSVASWTMFCFGHCFIIRLLPILTVEKPFGVFHEKSVDVFFLSQTIEDRTIYSTSRAESGDSYGLGLIGSANPVEALPKHYPRIGHCSEDYLSSGG